MHDLVIRSIDAKDRGAWEPLWNGYLSFYQRTVTPDITDFTWQRLASEHDLFGMIVISGEEALGLVHFLYHASTWNRGGNCYLEDLFIVPAARGRRIGRRLIAAVADHARARAAALLYWHTEEFNGTARRLYERVAKRTPSLRYNVEL
jgi:GNAT superfamily N-acetyltransferase